MRTLLFIIFFSLVLVIYSLLNYYIIRRGLVVFTEPQWLRHLWVWGIILLASSFIAGRFLERIAITPFTAALIWIGSFWLGIMVYLVLQLAVVDIVRGLDKILGFLPVFSPKALHITAYVIGGIAIISVTAGYINARLPKVTHLSLSIPKTAGHLKSLRIVSFSDVHLGTIIGRNYLKRIVERTNALAPDIILIPGDLIDEDIAPVLKNGAGDIIRGLNAPYGVYAVTGNHEYIGGISKARPWFKEHGITLLSDTAVNIANSFVLAGREDIAISQFTGKQRKSLAEIIKDSDPTLPLIVLDHQPAVLNEASAAGTDLQLSGHTHNGQLWPFNFITGLVYKKSAGYLKLGQTHIYISHGAGTWGPPVRTSSRPEIVLTDLMFLQ